MFREIQINAYKYAILCVFTAHCDSMLSFLFDCSSLCLIWFVVFSASVLSIVTFFNNNKKKTLNCTLDYIPSIVAFWFNQNKHEILNFDQTFRVRCRVTWAYFRKVILKFHFSRKFKFCRFVPRDLRNDTTEYLRKHSRCSKNEQFFKA